jgi:hypothetical protein
VAATRSRRFPRMGLDHLGAEEGINGDLLEVKRMVPNSLARVDRLQSSHWQLP